MLYLGSAVLAVLLSTAILACGRRKPVPVKNSPQAPSHTPVEPSRPTGELSVSKSQAPEESKLSSAAAVPAEQGGVKDGKNPVEKSRKNAKGKEKTAVDEKGNKERSSGADKTEGRRARENQAAQKERADKIARGIVVRRQSDYPDLDPTISETGGPPTDDKHPGSQQK